jgi:cellulose synthase (UDP-forming)
MEFVTGRYPWAQADPQVYVAAYRHFVDRCRLLADRVFYVWSPVGNNELAAYWPGRPYADYVGVSVYGFPEWDLDHHGRVRPFDEIFAEKYERVRGYDRPVMIAELGVTGSRDHQAAWLRAAARRFERYALLRSVVYFNAVDSRAAWPAHYRVPDWRLDRSLSSFRFAGR